MASFVLTGAAAAADPAAEAHLTVLATPDTPVNRRLFGVNYVWHLVPATAFADFVQAMRGPVGASLMRYPGGWAAERYDWDNNTMLDGNAERAREPGPEVGPQPGRELVAGVDPRAFLAAVPEASFVTPSVAAIRDPAQIGLVLQTTLGLMTRYGARVGLWEIGNEWWLQRGAKHEPAIRAQNLTAYAALVARVAPAIRAAAPGATIYATVEWTHPEDVAVLRALVGPEAWRALDGVSIHPYCGTLEAETLCSLLPQRVAQIRAAAGKPSVYASEWSLGPRVTRDDFGIRNANQMVAAFGYLASARLDAASYWPPARAVPGTALLSADCRQVFATGRLFGWMARALAGGMLPVSGDLPAAAGRQAGGFSLVVPSMGDGRKPVSIDLPSAVDGHVVEAEVMYAANDADPRLSRIVQTSPLPLTLTTSANGVHRLAFVLNPGTAGRGDGWEIARIVLR